MSNNPYDLVIFEDDRFVDLLPLVYSRAVFDLRCGCFTLRERICRVQEIDKPVLYVREDIGGLVNEQNTGRVCRELDPAGHTLFVNGRCFLTKSIDFSQDNLVGQQEDQIAFIWAGPELAGRLLLHRGKAR